MYIYFTVFLLCFVLGTWSLKIKVHDVTVKVLLFFLFLLLAFRYGQGSDYFGYQILFSYNSNLTEAINKFTRRNRISAFVRTVSRELSSDGLYRFGLSVSYAGDIS